MDGATKADFERLDVGATLAGAEQTCFGFSGLLDAKARTATADGDTTGAFVLSLLSDVCSYALRSESGREPFGPRAIFGDRRTASIEDLDEGQLSYLKDVYVDIPIPDLRARVADVLFVRRRHHDFGRVALDAYLESASKLLTPTDWAKASHLLERALSIALALKTERDRVVDRIHKELEARRGDPGYFSAKLMQSLLDARLGDAATLAVLAEEAAAKTVADKDWHREREYLLLGAQWSRRAGKADDERRLQRAAAESYVKLADDAGSRSLEATHLEHAIQALRTLGGTQARVEELHRRLLEAGKEAPAEFAEHSRTVNIAESAQRAKAHVAGKRLQDAILMLAVMWRPDPVARLREVVLSNARETPFFSLVPRVMVNAQGKVVAKRGSLMTENAEERERVLRDMMFERGAQQREVLAVTTLSPARAQIVEEHYLCPRELMALTTASPFVPPGREEVFAVGLSAGFNGDFAGALHLLMPQFENAVRMILAQNGAITSKVDDEGVQDERSLNELLYGDVARKVFGEDLLFEMQGLLIERFGGNLRNQMAHGLLDVGHMIGSQSIYFWWLTLHLVVRPLLPEPAEDVAGSTPAEPTDAPDK
jgi:hypothetical protein